MYVLSLWINSNNKHPVTKKQEISIFNFNFIMSIKYTKVFGHPTETYLLYMCYKLASLDIYGYSTKPIFKAKAHN